MLDVIDIAWTAGFLEGEGYFCSWRSGGCAVIASQVQREPLERLQAMYGGSLSRFTQANPNANPYYRWQLMGPQGRGLMMTIFKLMSPKRKRQITKVLTVWRARPPQEQFKTHCPRGHAYEGANLITRRNGARACRDCANGLRREAYARREV